MISLTVRSALNTEVTRRPYPEGVQGFTDLKALVKETRMGLNQP